MARFQYVILSRGVEGRDAEYKRWYDEQHLADVKRIPGVIDGRRMDIELQLVYDLDAPQWTSMTVYEIEATDPQAFLSQVRALAGTVAMPMTDALDKSGMVQAVARIRD